VSTVQEAEKLLSGMTRGEKAQLLQWVARDLGDAYPGIDSISGVCGGEPCIVRTSWEPVKPICCDATQLCARRIWQMHGRTFDPTDKRLNSKFVKTRLPKHGTVVFQ
jgi:hypothetical protein